MKNNTEYSVTRESKTGMIIKNAHSYETHDLFL